MTAGEGSAIVGALVLAHQSVGYAIAFAVAPLALAHSADPPRHRFWAKAFVYAMIPLYLTGLAFTLRLHDATGFVGARNLAFNFTGFFLVLCGWRAIHRYRKRALAPGPLDRAMRTILAAGGVALVALGVLHHFPSFVLGTIALAIAWRVLRPVADARALVVQHQRSILAGYFYLLTVLSLVHVRASTDVKWLWPALVGTPLVAWATRDGPDPRRMRIAVHAIVAIATAFALYIAIVSPPVFQLRR
ncbi:MAG: hypothetical protein ACHQJ7_03980 [Vicinamibacteria bacterium]